jgi:hypothetical protein
MTDVELHRRIAEFNTNYTTETGNATNHFFCPILFKDENVEMCRAHIVNDKLRTNSAWVPQRKDIDNFYGSVIEAEFVGVIEDLGKDLSEVFLDRESRRKHKPKIELEGKEIEYFFPKGVPPEVIGQTTVDVAKGSGATIAQMNLKISPEALLAAERREMVLVLERDYRPWVIAAVLKAAHLSLFQMMGYHHVFSSTGIFLASILRDFYELTGGNHSVADEVVTRYFSAHEAMIAPLFVKDNGVLRGSAEDNMFLTCFTGSDVPFIFGVIVRAKRHRFCVFLPTDQATDTYFGFLKNHPQSVRARLTRFRNSKDLSTLVWEIDTHDLRLPLGQALPEDWPVTREE